MKRKVIVKFKKEKTENFTRAHRNDNGFMVQTSNGAVIISHDKGETILPLSEIKRIDVTEMGG